MTNTIEQKLLLIQAELKAPKNRTNKFAGYKYRNAEDILESVKPYLLKYKCTLYTTETQAGYESLPMLLVDVYLKCTETTKQLHASAIVGVDLTSKGQSMPQRFGAASSYGKKYALGNLLLLDDTQDADTTNDHKPTTAGNSALQPLTKSSPKFQKTLQYLYESKDTEDMQLRLNKIKSNFLISNKLLQELKNAYISKLKN